MRKIEKAMCAAVKAHKTWSEGNTRVENVSGVSHVYLHGNLIAIVSELGRGRFTLAGRNTNTTKNRLRALGVDVKSKRGGVYYNGKEISSREWYNV